MGQDLSWLMRPHAAVDGELLAQALAFRLEGPITARSVEALDPSDDQYKEMLLVRVPPGLLSRM
ncbi:MAG: hypothetical protein ACKPKO_11870, partial [Candidatus Fonsibacter sp.]